jgi:methionyl aminopeptidase
MRHLHKQGPTIHTKEQFESMHKAGRLAADTLDYITDYVQPGVTTGELDQLCHDYIVSKGGTPAALNYRGFPKSVCISINHVICHGIPGDKKLKDGDILNIDSAAILDGWYGDSGRMYYAGKPSIKAHKLTEVTYECMMRGIEVVRPGATLGDVGHAIQSYAEKHKYSVVRDFCGHGLGQTFHDPYISVLHYGRPGTGLVLEEGMFFTIEPMINTGKQDAKILSDQWTAVTRDKSLSAQFEHSLGVTATGYEIFTLSPKGYNCPPYK